MKDVQILNTPGQSKMLDYYVNIYKDDVFVECHRFQNWSGTATQESVMDMRRYTYKPEDGYRLEW